MKVKPKEILLNLPIVLMFDDEDKIAEFASNINTLINGKIKVKYETVGILNEQYVGIFYLNRYDEYQELRESFVSLIEQEEILAHSKHNPTVEERILAASQEEQEKFIETAKTKKANQKSCTCEGGACNGDCRQLSDEEIEQLLRDPLTEQERQLINLSQAHQQRNWGK